MRPLLFLSPAIHCDCAVLCRVLSFASHRFAFVNFYPVYPVQSSSKHTHAHTQNQQRDAIAHRSILLYKHRHVLNWDTRSGIWIFMLLQT